MLRFISGAIALHSARSAVVVSADPDVVGDATGGVRLDGGLEVGRLIAMMPTTRAAVASNIAVTKPAVTSSARLFGRGAGGAPGRNRLVAGNSPAVGLVRQEASRAATSYVQFNGHATAQAAAIRAFHGLR